MGGERDHCGNTSQKLSNRTLVTQHRTVEMNRTSAVNLLTTPEIHR